MVDANIRLERKDHLAVVTLDRPGRLHAFNDIMFDLLEGVARELAASLPRAIVITATGDRSFSAGFDVHPDNPMVQRIVDSVSTRDEGPAREAIAHIRRAVDAFVSLPAPIIAALNGDAFGGGAELAVRCDLRVMVKPAVICFSEAKLGLMPDWGGGAALARLAGASRAADLVLTARKLASDEALAMGLVNRVCEPGAALGEALGIAALIAENGPRAVRHALALIRNSRNSAYDASLEEEARRAVELIASGECFHGVAAFLEKKKPEFPDI
ncbi:MAG: enoyl-CoA hydratase/isomerase family protein [Spirochaetes bacterium]|jgi:enoyl-CoA hydratase/carnithine racemase|nr:enoyl-CoA hydratase/isomerase family protein [Spirochaetota bacterium]